MSVVPNRMPAWLLDAVLPGWPEAAEEPERRQILSVDAKHVRFRHELARNAIAASAARRCGPPPPCGDRGGARRPTSADPSLIVHHAEHAGLDDVVADHALVAARRAAALDSNRQAYSHYRRASDFADRLELAERATHARGARRGRLPREPPR